MKKTVAGIGLVDMTPEEIAERQNEEASWLIEKSIPKEPTDQEILLQALETKVGLTQKNKDDARSVLKGK